MPEKYKANAIIKCVLLQDMIKSGNAIILGAKTGSNIRTTCYVWSWDIFTSFKTWFSEWHPLVERKGGK